MTDYGVLIQGVGSVVKFVFLAKLEGYIELSLTVELNCNFFVFFLILL